MKRYTFIVDFRGGTYISQVNCKEINEAIRLWATSLNIDEIKHFGQQSHNEILQQIEDNDNYPILLDGLDNVWCISFSIKKGFLLVNIVAS